MLYLKKLHLRSIGGKYVRTQTVLTPDGKQEEITVFTGENCLFIGQHSPLGTIVIHEGVFENEPLCNYVIVHETAHKRQWWALFRFPLSLFAAFSSYGLFRSSFASAGEALSNANISGLLDSTPDFLLATLLFALPFVFAWILELDADFKSIRSIGLPKFLELKSKMDSRMTFSLRSVFNLLLHPPTGVTVSLWDRFYGSAGDKKESGERSKVVLLP